jgi:hypothetical protein
LESQSHPEDGYQESLKRPAAQRQKASALELITVGGVMLTVDMMTHSLFAGVFVGFLLGIFWLALWSHRGFRNFVIWSLLALAIFIFLISKPWANQSKVSAPRTPVTPRALYR